jgi:hypothetical protein
MFVLVNQQLATLETYTLENLHNFLDVLDEEDGARHFNVSKVAGRLNVC